MDEGRRGRRVSEEAKPLAVLNKHVLLRKTRLLYLHKQLHKQLLVVKHWILTEVEVHKSVRSWIEVLADP